MSSHDTQGPQWDMFIIEVGERVCLLAFSTPGQTFVDHNGHRGEAFGNGLLLDPEAVEGALSLIHI